MKIIFPITLILLALSVLLNFRQCSSAKNEAENMLANNERLQTQIAERESRIKTADDSIHAIQVGRRILDSTFRVAEKRLKSSVASLKEKLTHLPKVFPLIPPNSGELDSIRVAFYTKDTVILKQDSLSVALTGQIHDQSKSFEAELEQERGKFYEQVKNTEDWKTSAETSMKLYQKEKRKKFSVGVSGGYSVVSTGGEIRTGPAIQVGIHWSLWKF